MKNTNNFKSLYLFYYRLILMLSLSALACGCEKLIEVESPIDKQIGKTTFSNDRTAASVLTGIYAEMSGANVSNLSIRVALSSDDLETISPAETIEYKLYSNSLTREGNQLFWTPFYATIFRANAAIEGLEQSATLTAKVKQRLLGEAKFIRAFMYFYLVNLYGRVPVITSTDLTVNQSAKRETIDKVYDQIIADLLEAKINLTEEYLSGDIVTPSLERLRPNKITATALLARVYLYQEKWALAEQQATEVINRSSTLTLEPLGNVYLSNSKEAIWQLQQVELPKNTSDARLLVLRASNIYNSIGPDVARPYYLNRKLYQSFTPDDKRKSSWIDFVTVGTEIYPYAFKYKVYDADQPLTEHDMVMRLAEQYLIRAEARLKLNKNSGTESSLSDLNAIRLRAGLGTFASANPIEIGDAILLERQHELFTEWGHRWMDLKRFGKIDAVMPSVSAAKGGQWASFKALYPIPVQDIQRNPSLRGDQNPGYPSN